MIVDIGGGTTEVAIISLADISVCESVRVAGDDFDEAIVNHMKKTYNMAIGEQMAERIKIEIGSAAPFGDDEPTMEVRGRDMICGLPRKTVVTSEEIREALQEPVTQIIEAVTRTLELAEPELAADLVDNGITMAGGSGAAARPDNGHQQRHRPGRAARRRPADLRRPRHQRLPGKPGTLERHDGERRGRGMKTTDAEMRRNDGSVGQTGKIPKSRR